MREFRRIVYSLIDIIDNEAEIDVDILVSGNVVRIIIGNTRLRIQSNKGIKITTTEKSADTINKFIPAAQE